jgi:hypothetical protein
VILVSDEESLPQVRRISRKKVLYQAFRPLTPA